MAQIPQSTVHISQSAARIARTIADLEAYPQWDSAVRSVEVLSWDKDKYPATARFTLDQAGPISGYTLAYRWNLDAQAQGEVSWSLVAPESILLAVDGRYRLLGDNPTEVTYELSFQLKGRLLNALAKQAASHIARSALAGLTARVEDSC